MVVSRYTATVYVVAARPRLILFSPVGLEVAVILSPCEHSGPACGVNVRWAVGGVADIGDESCECHCVI